MKRYLRYTPFLILLSLFFIQAPLLAQNNLSQKVKGAIENYYAQEFTVTDNGAGEVTIKGSVNTLDDKYRIFEIASKVPGVKKISNQIYVNTPERPDKMIQADVVSEMGYVSSILEPDSIKVTVTNGVVFLDGTVSYYREKMAMRNIASWMEGVKGIVNNIKVLPPEKAKSDANLENVLAEILKNEFPLENKVNFTVTDGKVVLNGKTNTLWARYNIAETFKNVRGIKSVENNINVQSVM